ncbi:18210_t:CDS:2 [Acaulospora morrowiae]|uniref:18210_t:CDS:1 n=1 Tax=Acaulospora morrowiae TaxID=94023 RepID=A0A9N9F8H1_9GLOM|nr:18210_t:CDS:2 [Acaulospora morrowiae]
MAHVKEKVTGYWLKHNRAYDEIVVKINPVSQGVMPAHNDRSMTLLRFR